MELEGITIKEHRESLLNPQEQYDLQNDHEYALLTKLVDQDKFDILEQSNNFKDKQNRENNRIISKLTKICFFCATFMTIELIGGYIAGSLAIMTDAAHLLSDLSGFVISMLSLWIALRPANSQLTYGYHRAEIIGALMSISIIWLLTAWLLTEAYDRLYNPRYINSKIMMIIASCGLGFNIIMAKVLMSNEDIPNAFEDETKPQVEEGAFNSKEENEEHLTKKDDNNPILRATIIHILGDMIQSLGVLIASIIIHVFQDTHPDIVKADPICTFVFGIIVLSTSIPIARDCINVLMEATPDYVNQEEMIKEFKNIPDIVDFHDIHLWQLSLGKVAMTAHFISNNPQKTLEISTAICKKYGVFHSTIQVEDYTQRRRASFKLCTHINDNQIH